MSNLKRYPSIVANKYDRHLKYNKTVCPYCESKRVWEISECSTMVAYSRPGQRNNGNHVEVTCRCKNIFCLGSFVKNYSYLNVWYTDKKGKILAGNSSCFESYKWACSYCHKPTVYKDYRGPRVITSPPDQNGDFFTIHKGDSEEWYICDNCGKEEMLLRELEIPDSDFPNNIVYGIFTEMSAELEFPELYKKRNLGLFP